MCFECGAIFFDDVSIASPIVVVLKMTYPIIFMVLLCYLKELESGNHNCSDIKGEITKVGNNIET